MKAHVKVMKESQKHYFPSTQTFIWGIIHHCSVLKLEQLGKK